MKSTDAAKSAFTVENSLTIRKVTAKDVDRLIDIHLLALPLSTMARLGRAYLKKRVYSKVLNNPDVLATVLLKKSKVLGFSIYSSTEKYFAEELSDHKWDIIKTLTKKMLFDPKLAIDCLTSGKITLPDWSVEPAIPYFYLFLIAVDLDNKRSGYGSILFQNGLQEAAKKFKKCACLVDAQRSESYNFYIKNGFSEIGHEMRGRRKFFKLFKSL